MPHRTFGAVKVTAEREPITFDFGLYGEERFTVTPEPSLGDTFDLDDLPDDTPETWLETVRALARFITRMLVPEDRPRFGAALHRIPASENHLIVECATYIAAEVTGFPTVPPTTSSGGRSSTGRTSRPRSAGKRR